MGRLFFRATLARSTHLSEAFAEMDTLPQEDSGVPRSKRPNIEEIIRRKDRSVDCDQCGHIPPMRYKKLIGPMAQWSPAPYAWVCLSCGGIKHDGSIDPNEKTWNYKLRQENRRRISSYLSSILREQMAQKEKSEPED